VAARRSVRVDPAFFDDLDRQLPAERGRTGNRRRTTSSPTTCSGRSRRSPPRGTVSRPCFRTAPTTGSWSPPGCSSPDSPWWAGSSRTARSSWSSSTSIATTDG